MNRFTLTTLMSIVFLSSGCGDQQSQPAGAGQQGTAPEQVRVVKAPESVATAEPASGIKATVGQAMPQNPSSQTVAQQQQTLQQKAGEMAQKTQVLLAQAKQYLDQGKLSEAITTAQNVLSFDPKNMDAQKIIETAKAKIKAMAEQKAADLKSDLMNKFGTGGK